MVPPEEKAVFFHACEKNGEEASTAIRRFMTLYATWTHSQRYLKATVENGGIPYLLTMEPCMVSRS